MDSVDGRFLHVSVDSTNRSDKNEIHLTSTIWSIQGSLFITLSLGSIKLDHLIHVSELLFKGIVLL